MRFCLLSDSHGQIDAIDRLLQNITQRDLQIDAFIHAGDLATDVEYLRLKTGINTYAVCGNCDHYTQRQVYKSDEFIQVANKMIWLTHGHQYLHSPDDLGALYAEANVFEANVVVYGHTHQPNITNLGGILFINPGSICLPRNSNCSYAVLQVDEQNLDINLYEIY